MKIGQYKVIDQIGSGSYSVVYLGENANNKKFAIKTIKLENSIAR